MELIERSDLLAEIQLAIEDSGCINHEHDIMDCIRYAPTVDAAPVRHGYWKRDDTWRDWYFCSACLGREHYNKPKHKYCPDCGARMDADAQERGGAQ